MFLFEMPSSPSDSDTGLLSGLIPNLDRARFLRAVALLLLGLSSVGLFMMLGEFVREFRARHSWPVARGEIVSCEEKTGERMPRRKTIYWMQCEVRFEVPIDQCLTGTTAADNQQPYPCYGTIISPSTTEYGMTYGWTNPQFLSTPKRILHDPQGPDVKLADEPVWLAYDLPNVLMMSAWIIAAVLFLAAVQWRIIVLRNASSQTQDESAT